MALSVMHLVPDSSCSTSPDPRVPSFRVKGFGALVEKLRLDNRGPTCCHICATNHAHHEHLQCCMGALDLRPARSSWARRAAPLTPYCGRTTGRPCCLLLTYRRTHSHHLARCGRLQFRWHLLNPSLATRHSARAHKPISSLASSADSTRRAVL